MMDFFNYFSRNKNYIVNKINFEDIQTFINTNVNNKLLINTLNKSKQDCLIKNTTKAQEEEQIIRKLIEEQQLSYTIFIYGENSNDNTVYKKYEQLMELGFINVYIYTGGIFEWLLLQDIYGHDNFSTTSGELDILKFKSRSELTSCLLTLD
jgi:hypothetical protein